MFQINRLSAMRGDIEREEAKKRGPKTTEGKWIHWRSSEFPWWYNMITYWRPSLTASCAFDTKQQLKKEIKTFNLKGKKKALKIRIKLGVWKFTELWKKNLMLGHCDAWTLASNAYGKQPIRWASSQGTFRIWTSSTLATDRLLSKGYHL